MAEKDRPSSERKFSRREMLRLAGLGSVGLLVAGCGPASTPEKVVEKVVETVVVKEEVEKLITATPPPKEAVSIFATSQMEVSFWQPSMERAKDMLPGVNLEVSNTQITGIGWSGYSDLVITQIAGGQQLDVIMIAVEGLPLLSSKKILLPLDPYFDADAEAKNILMTDIHKTLREMLQYEGQQMEFPFSWNNMVMYYNTKIYEDKGIDPPKPDWTWDDFLENCLKVADVKGTADDLFAYSFWGAGMFGMSFKEMDGRLAMMVFQKLYEQGNQIELSILKDFFGDLKKVGFRKLQAACQHLFPHLKREGCKVKGKLFGMVLH